MHAIKYANKVGMVHESKGQRIGKAPSLHLFHTTVTMTSLQFTQVQGLGFTRGMYRVPLSIHSYYSVIKVHGLGVHELAAYALHQLYRYPAKTNWLF